MGAAISAFGALNGWILVQGQWPRAAARDGLFPSFFGRLSNRGTPAIGLVVSSLFATGLVALNFTASLVDQFTFIILLATLSTLVPYAFSALAELVQIRRQHREGPGGSGVWRAVAISTVALAYSLWAIVGSGVEIIAWGAVLMISGLPLFAWKKRALRKGPTGDPDSDFSS
jgi:APA family basic amino acid/polyamine antiporter